MLAHWKPRIAALTNLPETHELVVDRRDIGLLVAAARPAVDAALLIGGAGASLGDEGSLNLGAWVAAVKARAGIRLLVHILQDGEEEEENLGVGSEAEVRSMPTYHVFVVKSMAGDRYALVYARTPDGSLLPLFPALD
jgi:hypothetical protein